MQFVYVAAVLCCLGVSWALPYPENTEDEMPPAPGGPHVVSAEYIRKMAAQRKARDDARRQLAEEETESVEEVDEPVTAHCPKNGEGTNPCLNGGACIPVMESTPTGHNYVCRCKGDFGGFVCGVAHPCDSCDVYCVRTSLDSRGRYCYNEKFELVDEFPALTGNPHKMMTAHVKGKMRPQNDVE